MEEAPSNKSDAATRKRRSSILKSQRAPRTPFSDLEFNVATPSDTSKSRRVSFSRRTGVAEFATNEATTTWKNFYEEHNKSLESSGNDSGANGTRQIASLGRRSFFDKQFQEVEGVDFIETLNPGNPNFNTSVSHINFSNQLSGLDCTEGDQNLEAPEHFDFGSITNHQTNVFEDDIGIAIMGEVTGRIDMNFSMVQTIGSKDKDDLEQLKKDIQQGSSNRNCPTSSQDGKDLSEYIEFDLDVTRGPIQDVSDMSITDTILSPKVQNVSKNNSVLQKSQGNADWVADKENIVLDPYAAPREADNFAINEESDKVLVFDGKKLTVQNTNTSTIENVVKEPQRKTIVLNMHDDLPNFVDEFSVAKQLAHKFDNNETLVYDISNISMSQSVPTNIITEQVYEKRKTILFNDGHISVTQSLPAQVLIPEEFNVYDEKTNKTISNEDCDISMTQAVVKNVILTQGTVKSKRNTILFDNNSGDISMTQVLPANLIFEAPTSDDGKTGRRKTIVYDENSGDISCTQVIPTNIIVQQPNLESTSNNSDKTIMKSCLLEETLIGNIKNQPKDSENAQSTKRKTIVFYDDAADISVTQAIPTNILNAKDAENFGRRKTIVYDESSGDISCTQVIPTNIILSEHNRKSTTINTVQTNLENEVLEQLLIENKINNFTDPNSLKLDKENNQSSKRKTIVFEDDAADISVTQAIRTNILNTETVENAGRRKTIVYDEASGDISCTQVIPSHIILPPTNNLNTENVENAGRRKTIVFDEASGDISCTQVIPSHIILPPTNNLNTENVENAGRRKTIVYDEASGDISCTQVIPSHIILPPTNNLNTENVENAGRRKTIVYDEASGDISCTQVIPPHIILPPTNNLNTENVENAGRRKTIVFDEASGDISCTQVIPSHIILPPTNNLNTENVENAGRRKTIVYDEASGDISCTQVILPHIILPPTNMDTNTNNTQISKSYVLEETCIGKPNEKENEQSGKRKTIVFEDEFANISVTQAIPTNIFTAKSTTRKTILFDQDVGDMSVTQAILTNLISNKSLDATTVAHCQDVNKSHISALGMSLKIKPKSLDVQEFQMETGKETDDSFMNINKSVHSVSLQKEDFSKTQDVLDQISAIIDCSDAKQPTGNSEKLNETKNLPSKVIRMISNSTLDQEPKSDVIINKTSQNTSIYNLSINLENISSKKISLNQENAVDPHNVISKSDVIQLVSVSQSCEENPVLTSTENIQKMSSANATSKTSTSLISASIKTDLTMTSLDKKKSMLNELLDMSNDSMDYVPKSINKSKNISQSVQSYINIGDDSFDIDKEATELPKDTSTTDKDNIILIPGEDIVSVIKEQDNVVIPKLEKPDPLETDDFIGFKPESTEEQVRVDCRPDVIIKTDLTMTSLDKKKSMLNQLLDMSNDSMDYVPKSINKSKNISQSVQSYINIGDDSFDIDKEATELPKDTSTTDKDNIILIPGEDIVSVIKEQDNVVIPKLEKPDPLETDDFIGFKPESTEEQVRVDCRPDVVIKTDLTMTSLDKKKSMLNQLLDMSNDSMDYVPKSINKSKNISQSVQSYINIGDDSFDIDKEATELPKDTSTTDKDNIILIPGEDIVSVIKEQDNVVIPKLEKPDPLETDDFIGFKPESTEEQVRVDCRPDVVNVTENEIISLDNTYKKAQEIFVLDMHNDVTKEDPLSKSKENNIADGSLANMRDCTDEVKDEKMDLNSNASKVQSVTMNEKSAMDIVVEEKRPSYAPRLSRITREDFLNNLSLAQQILQNTNLELDTSMNDDSTECSIEEMDDTDEFVEANRTNNEVVKKLDFEDDSSEFENKSDVSSSLHKPSKSQLAQDLESKSIVIPPYSSLGSEDIKDPMNDLVELTADSVPIERNENISEYASRMSTIPEREDSMCSDQIQANLVSQIDVDTQICFDSESVNNVIKVTQSKNKSVSLASAVKIVEDSENDVTGMIESLDNKQPIRQESPKIIRPDSRTDFSEANTIVIENDKNPLSKVSLSPLHDKESSFKNESYVLKMPENDQVSMQCGFKSFTESKDRLQSRNAAEIFSTESKICSIDKVTVAKPQLCEMKDAMVNTILVNQDLSKTSASISVDDVQSCGNSNDMVIDDVLDDMESQKSVVNSKAKKRFYSPRTKNSFGVDKSSPDQSSKMIKISNSPHTTNAEKSKSKDSESAIFSSADVCILETSAQDNNDYNAEIIETSQNNSSSYATKTKRVYHSSFRKSRHNSVGANSVSFPVTSPEANDAIDVDMILEKESDLASPISRTKENKNVECPNEENAIKTGTNMTAQNVSIDCIRQNDVLEPHTLIESSEKTVETKNDKTVGDKSIRADTSDTIRSRASKISSSEVASDDLKCTVLSEHKEPIALASKRIVKSKAMRLRDDGALNVVPQIEKLPDIGSRKFSWEAHNAAWSFSLLYGRLRLCVRLQRNSDNEPRSYVRADTPIEEVNLDIPYQDTSNSISSTCANFTANTIQHIISRGTWDCASTVPNLLKKCLERVRVGFNWARALHEAWYTMAYKLHDDNKLSVSVANVPLSSVWNVTMRFELVVPEDGEVPWPKAVDVVVHEVVSDVKITKSQIADLLDGLPNDWSHVPRALWKVYDYLGNLKEREEMEWQAVFKHIHKTRV